MGERGVPDMGGIERHQMPGGKIGPGGPTAPSEATPPAGTSGFRNKGRTVSPDIS